MNVTIEAVTDGRLSAYDLKALLDGSTYASMLVQYERTVVPMEPIAEELFNLPAHKARALAKAAQLPVPVFQLGGPRSPWMIHVHDLAKLVDQARSTATSKATEAAA